MGKIPNADFSGKIPNPRCPQIAQVWRHYGGWFSLVVSDSFLTLEEF
jgi:hypothetical protein